MILGIDTSTERLSLALVTETQPPVIRNLRSDQRHGERLLPELTDFLSQAGTKPEQLSGIAVGRGPGSFTGVRVGVAAALGLAQALGRPLAGVSSFAAVAAASGEGLTLVVSDARRGEVYAALFQPVPEGVQVIWPEQLLDASDLPRRLPAGPIRLAGPASEEYLSGWAQQHDGLTAAAPDVLYPQADWIAKLARPDLARGGHPWEAVTPMYLRRTQAEEVRERSAGSSPS